jgi:hypothetical protein
MNITAIGVVITAGYGVFLALMLADAHWEFITASRKRRHTSSEVITLWVRAPHETYAVKATGVRWISRDRLRQWRLSKVPPAELSGHPQMIRYAQAAPAHAPARKYARARGASSLRGDRG